MDQQTVYCHRCGKANPAGQRFCGDCGAALASTMAGQPAISGQGTRRGRVVSDGERRRSYLVLGITIGVIVLALLGKLIGAIGSNGTSSTSAPANTAVIQRVVAQDTPAPTDTPKPLPTDTSEPATQTPDEWALGATQDTYIQVNDHPDLYQGDRVVWRCTIQKFLGADANDASHQDVGCNYPLSAYDTPEIILNVPPEIDVSQMDSGDSLTVYGTVDQPMQGTTAMGVDSSWPQIDVAFLVDKNLPGPTATAMPSATPVPVARRKILDLVRSQFPGDVIFIGANGRSADFPYLSSVMLNWPSSGTGYSVAIYFNVIGPGNEPAVWKQTDPAFRAFLASAKKKMRSVDSLLLDSGLPVHDVLIEAFFPVSDGVGGVLMQPTYTTTLDTTRRAGDTDPAALWSTTIQDADHQGGHD